MKPEDPSRSPWGEHAMSHTSGRAPPPCKQCSITYFALEINLIVISLTPDKEYNGHVFVHWVTITPVHLISRKSILNTSWSVVPAAPIQDLWLRTSPIYFHTFLGFRATSLVTKDILPVALFVAQLCPGIVTRVIILKSALKHLYLDSTPCFCAGEEYVQSGSRWSERLWSGMGPRSKHIYGQRFQYPNYNGCGTCIKLGCF